MRFTSLVIPFAALWLVGCNAAPTQPQPPKGASAAEAPSSSSQEAGASEPATSRQSQAESFAETARAVQSGFDQLSGRLTLLQEQVLQLRSDNQRLLEQNQMLLNQLELLSSRQVVATEGEAAAGMDTQDMAASGQLDAAIGQLMQLMNQLEIPDAGQGQFGLATTYTQQGDWVLLRFDRITGETWMAEYGDWQQVSDDGMAESSLYDVQISRADRNTAGYVAVRIDLNSGRSWWLNGKRWQEY